MRLLANEDVPIAVDAAESWSAKNLATLNDIITGEPARHWIVAGRILSGLPAVATWSRIGTDDLRFDQSQVGELLAAHRIVDPTLTEAVTHLSSGWPKAVRLIASQMAEATKPATVARDLGRHNAVLDSLVNELVDPSSPDGRAVTTLAALPFFDRPIADMLGEAQLLDRLAAAGLPIRQRGNGRAEFLEPARTALQTRAVRGSLPVEIIEHFVDGHNIHAALDTCLAFGDRKHAARLLASLSRQQEAHLDPDKLHATVAALGSAVEEHPRALYVHAHVSAVHGHGSESLRSIERGAAIFAARDPHLEDEHHLETLMTLGVWRVYDSQLADARTILDRVANAIGSSLRLQAMLHDLTGLLHHALGSDNDLDIATEELKAAYNLWRQLNEPEAATVTMLRVAGVLASRGQRGEALILLDDLPKLGPMSLHTTARLGLERALLLPQLGRSDEVDDALRETKRISKLLEDDWTFALALVAEVVAASMLGDGDKVVARSRELVDDGHFTFETVPEGQHWVDVADALARCERWPEARAAVEIIASVRDMPKWMLLYSEASIEARCGDPDRALDILRTLEVRDDVETDRRWQLRLYGATAHRRAGRLDEASKLLDEARQEAAALSAPELPQIVEGVLVDAIVEAPKDSTSTDVLVVSLFGALQAQRHGVPVVVPAGNTATLLKLLASAEGRMTVDQVIEAVWPGTGLEVGRRRLRNVVWRLREACGDVIERNGDLIELSSVVSCDYAEAVASARHLLQEPTASLEDLNRVLDQLDKKLLEDTPYEDWADAVRDEQLQLIIEVLDRLGTVAASANKPASLGYFQRADDLDPMPSANRTRLIRSLLEELG